MMDGVDNSRKTTEDIVRLGVAHVPEGRGTFVALALELADHVYLLETGKVVLSGPSEIVKNDETLRKAHLSYGGTGMEFLSNKSPPA